MSETTSELCKGVIIQRIQGAFKKIQASEESELIPFVTFMKALGREDAMLPPIASNFNFLDYLEKQEIIIFNKGMPKPGSELIASTLRDMSLGENCANLYFA